MVLGSNESLLRGINFAALVGEGVDQNSLERSIHALEEVGATVRLVSMRRGALRGPGREQSANGLQVHLSFDEADPLEFSGALVPAGERHAEVLRKNPAVREFIIEIADAAKPIAACAEGIVLLLDTGLLQDRAVAAPEKFKGSLAQAGAKWSEKNVEADGLLVTAASTASSDELIQTLLEVTANHVKQHVKGTLDEKASIGPSS